MSLTLDYDWENGITWNENPDRIGYDAKKLIEYDKDADIQLE